MLHAGCSLAAAHKWCANFPRYRSPWSDDAIRNLRADAAQFNVPFLRALDGLVRAHPELFLPETSSVLHRLATVPDLDQCWPTSRITLGAMLSLIGFSCESFERLASERCLFLIKKLFRLSRHIPDRCIVVSEDTHMHGAAMIRPRGRSRIDKPLEALAPDRRPRQRFSFIVSI